MPLSAWHRDILPLERAGVVAFVVLSALAAAVLGFTLPPSTASVNVRWREGVTVAERIALEPKFHLTQGRVLEGTTHCWITRQKTSGPSSSIQTSRIHIVWIGFSISHRSLPPTGTGR